MAVSTEIMRSWRGPRASIRRQLDGGVTEPRLLSYLLIATILIIVAQAPSLARQAHFQPEQPFEVRMFGAMMGILAFLPPFSYLLAALSHLVARGLGGQGSWRGARLALFWTLLAIAPGFLFHGLVAGFIGPGPALTLTGALLLSGFLAHWLLSLAEAEEIGALR